MQMKDRAPSFLIVSFDGLRPDLITPELTPNIARLQSLGTVLSEHRTVYPSETRSAIPSLVTGAAVNRHGLVGNKYIERTGNSPHYIDTSDVRVLRMLREKVDGSVFCAPTLGEIMESARLKLAVLATNSAGTTWLFNDKANCLGHIRLSGSFREVCTPRSILAEAEERIGAIPGQPKDGLPDEAGQEWITSAFLDLVWPEHRPDVTILSFGEPDTTSHFHGTAAETTCQIIAHCDDQFGRILDWWEAEGRADNVQMIVISDHGHIAGHTRVEVVEALRQTGLRADNKLGTGVDVMVVPGQVGALYLAEPSTKQLERVVAALASMPWCGSIFTRAKNEVEGVAAGSLSNQLVFIDHHRAPDISFSFRADDRIDRFGKVGAAFYDNDRMAGLGVHGGLHPKELRALGIVAGSAFGPHARVSTLPSGICDVAPTILHLLNVEQPAAMTGRVLHEVLSEGPRDPPVVRNEVFEAQLGSFSQELHRVCVESGGIYIQGGFADG